MSNGDLATRTGADPKETEVGSVFVSNYPPFSFWTQDRVGEARDAFGRPPASGTPLGLYLHIPFCRKRCKFCYFKVYTDKNAAQVERYIDTVTRELDRQAAQPAIGDRPLKFVYFGGGTPSFLAGKYLRALVRRMKDALPWDAIDEVTFECEPGTLTRSKLEAIRELGVTRLSLGVENWNDAILEGNGRAHVTKEIHRVLPWIRELEFDQLNIDLIAGMIGETDATWKDSVARTVDEAPDSVTIYELELPFNTIYSKKVLGGESLPVADWATKRRWHDEAIETLSENGYEVSSAYTMVREDRRSRFVYRDSVWRGADLLGVGVSSFGHMNGVHYQNRSNWDRYLEAIDEGGDAIDRAYRPTDEERLTREWILQMKLGRVKAAPFVEKFGVNPLKRFAAPLARLAERGMLKIEDDGIRLTREGLLRVDSLLPGFYAERYQNARYT